MESLAVALENTDTFDFAATFHGQYARIVKLVHRVVKDRARAEEIAVEAFWKLWRNPEAHGIGANGWLYRTAIRMALDELRKHHRREKYEKLFGLPHTTPTPEQLHSVEERQGQVRTVLAVMKRRDAELLLLRSDGLRYQEIGQVLELNPASVGTLLTRAQQIFRKEYVKRYGTQ